MQLFARVTGSGSPVILLHGLFGAQENLGMLARQLAPTHQVHSVDLRNHGRSPHSDQFDYPCMATDLLTYLDQQRLQQVDLVGHSMGGKVAMQLAVNHPERLRRLVVLDMAPTAYTHRHQTVFDALQSVVPDALTSRQEADAILSQTLSEAGLRQFLLQNLIRKQGRFYWRFNLPVLIQQYAQIIAAISGPHPFTGPTLFLKGGDSDYLLPEHREAILNLFPQARVRLFDHCGHWLHAEAPERVGRVISQFLSR